MKAKLKEIGLVLATALGLFAMVFGVISILEPATVADSLSEPPIKVVASVATPTMETQAKPGASLFARNCAH